MARGGARAMARCFSEHMYDIMTLVIVVKNILPE